MSISKIINCSISNSNSLQLLRKRFSYQNSFTSAYNFFKFQNKNNLIQVRTNCFARPPLKPNLLNQYEINNTKWPIKYSNRYAETKANDPSSTSIFKRFKEAYKQHGKILIAVHFTTGAGWVFGFFLLSKSGYDISHLFNLFQKLHILSKETIDKLNNKINTFNLEKFLKNSFFDYIMPDELIKKLGGLITGVTLKNIITAIVLYKMFTPFRYLLTLGVTKLVINLFKKRGIMPQQPPPGSTIKELYQEQSQSIKRRIKKQREKYDNTRVGRFFRRSIIYKNFNELNKRKKLK